MIPVLAEVSDAVWLAAIAAVVTIVNAVMSQRTKAAVEKTAADAAVAVEKVRTNLEDTKSETATEMAAIKKTANETLQRVNGGMKAQLEISAASARTLADITNKPVHKERAQAADEALAAHMRTDAEVRDGDGDESQP